MMKSIKLMCAAAMLASVVAAPALAQMASGSMMSGDHMKMSKMDQKKMAKCNAMSHEKMMKNASCTKMMKMHPDMMKGR